MLCSICGDQEATIHITEVVNNKMIELHLCEECATQKEVETAATAPINDILSGLIKFTSEPTQAKEQLEKTCPKCQSRIVDLRNSGKVGCAECYQTFSAFLLPLIKKIHGGAKHCGKQVGEKQTQYELESKVRHLTEKLQMKIEMEDYEEAASIKAEIDKLKSSQDKKKPRKKATRKTAKKKKSGE